MTVPESVYKKPLEQFSWCSWAIRTSSGSVSPMGQRMARQCTNCTPWLRMKWSNASASNPTVSLGKLNWKLCPSSFILEARTHPEVVGQSLVLGQAEGEVLGVDVVALGQLRPSQLLLPLLGNVSGDGAMRADTKCFDLALACSQDEVEASFEANFHDRRAVKGSDLLFVRDFARVNLHLEKKIVGNEKELTTIANSCSVFFMDKTPTAQVAILMAELVYFHTIRREIEAFESERPDNWKLVQIGFNAAHDGVHATIDALCDNNASHLSLRFLAQAVSS